MSAFDFHFLFRSVSALISRFDGAVSFCIDYVFFLLAGSVVLLSTCLIRMNFLLLIMCNRCEFYVFLVSDLMMFGFTVYLVTSAVNYGICVDAIEFHGS